MKSVYGHGLQKSHYESTKIMAYNEKHKLLEVFRRMTAELSFKRSVDVESFIGTNLKDISSQVYAQRICLLTPSTFDNKKLTKVFWKFYKIPAIVYDRERGRCDGDIILKKFKKFLKAYNLDLKNLIFFNFPDCRVECLQFHKARMDPTSVIEVVPSFQVPFKTHRMLEIEGSRDVWKCNQIASYFRNIFHKMLLGPPAGGYKLSQKDIRYTVNELCADIVELIHHSDVKNEEAALGGYLPRVLILGRKCSGRKTQARAMAKEYNLVYVNFKDLLLQEACSNSPFGDALRNGIKSQDYSDSLIAAILYKRILQKDCLHKGWVVVGYPHDIQGFINMEMFVVQPNKIFFIHCREKIATKRFEKQLQKSFDRMLCVECDPGLCTHNVKAIDEMKVAGKQELAYFNVNKKPILKYLSMRKEVIHIDGNHSVATVKSRMWSRLNQHQNNVGLIGNRMKC